MTGSCVSVLRGLFRVVISCSLSPRCVCGRQSDGVERDRSLVGRSEGRPFSSGGGRRLTPPLLTPGRDASRVSAWQPVGATSSPLSQGIFHPLVKDAQGTVDGGELLRSLKWTHQ